MSTSNGANTREAPNTKASIRLKLPIAPLLLGVDEAGVVFELVGGGVDGVVSGVSGVDEGGGGVVDDGGGGVVEESGDGVVDEGGDGVVEGGDPTGAGLVAAETVMESFIP